jgi:hypothetical protein
MADDFGRLARNAFPAILLMAARAAPARKVLDVR